MTTPQVSLGGEAHAIKIGQIGYGLMGLTWRDASTFPSDESAFAVMKQSVDAGCTLWDAGAFYGPPTHSDANLTLVRRFFEKYPDYKERVVLCVKGGIVMDTYREKGMPGLAPDMSEDNLRNDLREIREALGSDQGGHDVDLYEVCRIDKRHTTEQWMKTLLKLRSEGLFKHIALSEVGAQTIRDAAAVGPVSAVEIEFSPWELEAEKNGVIEACESLQIPILAYSPVGKGMLTGAIKSRDDIPKGDIRLHQDRFSEENFDKNIRLGQAFQDLAQRKGCTAAQLVLAWNIARNPSIMVPIPGSTNVGRAKENAESVKVKVTDEDDKSIRDILETMGVAGGRYSAVIRAHGSLWA
ncbi:Aldo/keto reductase [Acaromyces ingoldii]|uniref:Aldo/keto reductase n=1 Tax=Acaromyces ingoldii TaxID=215250 RepID=A0A316YGX6_9BASI|nr:Aldo/keto reductase [Acaromyces ingoldii]PWN88336.1 Aldo/keto reductase [Acaromyces ingoldii]